MLAKLRVEIRECRLARGLLFWLSCALVVGHVMAADFLWKYPAGCQGEFMVWVFNNYHIILVLFPFLLLAAFCFGKSSERLHNWFIGTKLYKNNLESYVQGKGMTKGTKIRIMVTVTLLMGIGFVMMHQMRTGQIILCCVWVFHILYFSFGVKTLPVQRAKKANQ